MQEKVLQTYLRITNVHHFIGEYVLNNCWLDFGVVHTHGSRTTIGRLFLFLFC